MRLRSSVTRKVILVTTQAHTLDRSSVHFSAGRVTITLAAAIILAVAVNSLVARLAITGGADPNFPPFALFNFGTFTLIGVLAGWLGWYLVQRHTSQPAQVLRWLVPVVGVLSFIPDIALGVLKFIPGTNWPGAIGLMAMHLVVIAVAVPAYVLAGRRPGQARP